MIPYDLEAYQLLHEGAIALAQVESNGIRIDTEYLDRACERQSRRIARLNSKLHDHEVMKLWRKEYRGRTNPNSIQQLGYVLFEIMGYPFELTEKNMYKTDEAALSKVDNPFVRDFLRLKKARHILNTYLLGIKREVVNNFLHPFFSLHLARTFRSSSDSPNFQNIPIRDPQVAKLVRQAIVARPGRRLIELDYSGIEVAIAACYHQDPTMLEYLEDDTKDMHRDMAMQCFKLPLRELTPANKEDTKRAKNIRYCGKNMFVFPQFYGDWYIDCARNLWNATESMSLKLRDGTPVRDHLINSGICSLGECDPGEKPAPGTMEAHIHKVERHFWTQRFPIYDQWRRDWIQKYMKNGWMRTLTGFICQGPLKRNEIINYPVQGSAFHCLLKSLIELQKNIENQGMKTLLVGQIHDSIIADVPDEETEDYLQLAHEVMVDRLKSEWNWIIAPLEIEAEITPVNGNWYQKQEHPIK